MTGGEEAEVFAVEARRAFTDPVVAYEGAERSAPMHSDALLEAVTADRFRLAVEAGGEPVRMATWPEVAIYCSSASLTNQAWARGTAAKIYKFAFKRTLERDGFPGMSSSLRADIGLDSIEWRDDAERRKAGELRVRLKRTRDERFLESEYDEWDVEAPKVTWERDVSRSTREMAAPNAD